MREPTEPAFKLAEYWIAKRPNSEKYYRFWWDKESRCTRRASLGTTDLQEAIAELKLWYVRHHHPENEELESVPLPTVLRIYYEEHAMDLPSHEALRIGLTKWLDHFGAVSVAEAVKPQSIERFIDMLEGKDYSPNYINRILASGRAAINRAYKRGMLKNNAYIREVKVGYTPPKGRPLSMDEMRALYHLTDKDYLKRFILWMVGTVARPTALFELHLSHIDLEHNLVQLNPEGRAQNKKYRPTVKLPETLRDYVGEGPYLLMNKERRVDDVRYAWRRVRKAAGFGKDVTPYSIRHTMARHLRICGVPAWEVSAQLGHKQPGLSVTEIYAPFAPAYLATSVQEIDKYLKTLLIPTSERPLTWPVHVQCPNHDNPCDGICSCNHKGKMVVDTRIELVTPAMSMQCSTAELIDHLYFVTAQIGLCGPSVKRLSGSAC